MLKKVLLVGLVSSFGVAGLASAQQLEQVVEDLAVQISDSLTAQEKKKVAILPFTDLAGQRNQLGQLLAEELINQLFIRSSGRFEVVERNRIDAIWAEQELGAEGWMTAEAIGGIGQLVGADAILTGSIAELNDRLRVNARLMSVPAGQLFATASTFMLKTGLEPLLDPIDDGSGGGGSGAPKARAQRVTVKNITFEVVGCEKQTRLITCRLVATNNDVDRDVRINTADYNPGTYLFDQQGRSFASQFVKIANQESGSYVTSRLITEVPTAIEVQFQGVPSTIEFVKILTIDTNLDTIEFRDIRF